MLSWPEGTTPRFAAFTTLSIITSLVEFCGATAIVADVSFIPVSIPETWHISLWILYDLPAY